MAKKATTRRKPKAPEPKPEAPKKDPAAEAQSEFEKEAEEMMGEAVGEDLMGLVGSIAGLEMRPVTMASISLLKMTNNNHISGLATADIPNLMEDTAKFLVLHDVSRSLLDAGRLAKQDQAMQQRRASADEGDMDLSLLEGMGLELMDTLDADRIPELNSQVILAIKEAMLTKVKVEPDKDAAEKEDDSGNE